MIKLLNGHSLTEKARFQPESQPMTLNQRQSTTRIVVGPSAPEIIVGDWLQEMDEPGKGIVWRVKSIDDQVETKTRTLVLEHVINTLRDKLMFGAVTPKTITGNNSATTCTAEEAVEYILNQQSDWVLGSFGYGLVSNPYNFNGDDLLSALNTVSGSLEDCWWSYDTTVYPFVLNITTRAAAVSVELRAMRNIQTAKITIDKSRMYTRLYPIGKNNIHIDGDYVSKNEEYYGIIEKTETDQSKATKEELLQWANELINTHSEPLVTITVGVTDLSSETGESLDHIVLGAMCRMPLKGYETVIEEIITQLSYPDKIREPKTATATLANIQEDVASIINNLIKSGSRGSRTSAKDAEEDHAWIEDTKDHIALIAEGIAGEGAAEDWSRVAELLVDGNGIHQRVTEAQGDIVTAYALIDMTTTAIRSEIGTVAEEVRSFIQQTPDMIHAEVGYAVSGFAHSVIEQTATYIRTEVNNAASEISQSVIEQTTEYVRTEVSSVASGVAWSVVTQTMTNIQQQIARKSKVYMQWTDPNDGENVLYEGDIWIQADTNKTWGANSTYSWNSQASKQWRAKYGDLYRVWKGGMWILSVDTSRDVENSVEIEHNNKVYAINAKAKDLEGQEYNSRLEVTAREIRSSVSTAKSQLYSVISQTATNIRAIVANEVEGLQSSIEQTAYSITTSVSAAKSSMYSVIVQTSTQIIQKVANDIDDVQAAITVESNRISLVVEGTGANAKIKPAEIVASINDGESNIRIAANHIVLDGYVKATDITSEFINGKIAGIQSIGVKDLAASGSISIKEGNVYYAVARSIKDLDLSKNGNTYTLKYKKWDDQNWTTLGTFSRAVASVDWSLSNGTLKVTPQPQNQEFTLGSLTSYRTFTHNAQETPSNFERATNGYYIKDSGLAATVRIYTGADMTIGGKVLYSTNCDVDDYLETMPTNVYHDGYNSGYNNGRSSISSSDITNYDLFTTNAPSTPSEYERSNHGYYIKNAGAPDAEVRIYTYAEMTVNGKLLRSSSASLYDYLRVMPTYVYEDAYKYGYDADHSMFIGDSNEDDVGTSVNVEVGTPVEVWAYFKKKGSGYQWSSKYTFTAVDPYPHSIAVKKAMTGVDQSELPVYYGKLYALIQGSYQAITSNNYYWYYSSTNISSGTLHY